MRYRKIFYWLHSSLVVDISSGLFVSSLWQLQILGEFFFFSKKNWVGIQDRRAKTPHLNGSWMLSRAVMTISGGKLLFRNWTVSSFPWIKKTKTFSLFRRKLSSLMGTLNCTPVYVPHYRFKAIFNREKGCWLCCFLGCGPSQIRILVWLNPHKDSWDETGAFFPSTSWGHRHNDVSHGGPLWTGLCLTAYSLAVCW